MADIKELAESLVNLTVKEANELADLLKEEYGIEPAGGAVAVAAAPGAGGDGEAEEAQTEFDVILKSGGSAKLKVVKEIKNLLGMGLKDAKALVDGAPAPVKEGIPKEEADELAKTLTDLGAEVEVK